MFLFYFIICYLVYCAVLCNNCLPLTHHADYGVGSDDFAGSTFAKLAASESEFVASNPKCQKPQLELQRSIMKI